MLSLASTSLLQYKKLIKIWKKYLWLWPYWYDYISVTNWILSSIVYQSC